MRYRLFERLLLDDRWSSEEDEEGDMEFTKGDACIWVQWDYSGQALNNGYLYSPDCDVTGPLNRVTGISSRGDNTRIWWDDGDYWSLYYY